MGGKFKEVMRVRWRSLARALGVYRLYEKILENEVRSLGNIPEHVAFILDGNRRWARLNSLPPWIGHKYGAEVVERVLDWCYELGIKTVSLYVLSTENLLKRDPGEMEHLLKIIGEKLDEALSSDKFDKREVRFKAIGELELLPRQLQEKIRRLEEKTRKYDKRFLNIAIAYGGRREILDAVKRIIRDAKEGKIDENSFDEDMFESYLYTADLPQPEPDLVIRTSGEVRISNFLLWQIAYSELVFLDVYWPEFRKIDLLRAIRTYQKRQRRFGG